MRMKAFLIALVSVTFAGCVSHREDAPWHEGWSIPYLGKEPRVYVDYATMVNQWKGQSLKSLTDTWGQPTRMQYGIDGHLYVQYVTMRLSTMCQQNSIESSYDSRLQGATGCQQAQLVNCRTIFTVDDSGAYTQDSSQKIVNVSYEGPYCGL